MAMPMMTGSATAKLITPVDASACKMPTAAEALCKMAVKIRPKRMPRMGCDSCTIRFRKNGLERSGATASLMALMPNIKTAKPMRISPTCWRVFSLESIRRQMPTTEMTPVSVAVENSSSQPLPESVDRQMTQPVMLVPTMAPMTMLIDWRTCIMPELTKPTTMTDVADDD